MGSNSNSFLFTRSTAQWAQVSNESPFQLTTTIGISGWIRLNSTGIKQIIISKSDGTGVDYSWELYIDTDNKLKFGTCTTNPTELVVSSNTALSTGSFYYITVNYTQSTHTVDFYVNNSSDGSPTGASPTQRTNSVPVGFGSYAANPGNYFDGYIDEFVVSSNTFTTAQRTLLYNGYKATDIGLTGVIAYWKGNNDFTDSSGNSQILTPNGSPNLGFSSTVPFSNYALFGGGALFF